MLEVVIAFIVISIVYSVCGKIIFQIEIGLDTLEKSLKPDNFINYLAGEKMLHMDFYDDLKLIWLARMLATYFISSHILKVTSLKKEKLNIPASFFHDFTAGDIVIPASFRWHRLVICSSGYGFGGKD